MAALFILVAILGATSVQGQTPCITEGDVRLDGLIATNGGRVEVCLGGVWGTICDSSAWSQKNAQVACRQLTFGILAYNSILPNTLPETAQAAVGTPIHYSNVMCTGTEQMVSQCPLSTDVSSCDHGNDVAIFCRTLFAEEGDVRLLGDATDGVGAVEIYEDVISGWRTICPDISVWTDVTANAACVQLGYGSGTADNFSLPTVPVGIGSIGVDGITCEVEDYTLQECTISYTDTPSCSAAADTYAGVRCQSSDQPDGSLRLFGANSTTEGRVEILYNGRWGAVCDDQWSNRDGEVACRQLGENDEFVDADPLTIDFRGASEVKPIWLSGLQCDGTTESSLTECPRSDRPIGFSTFCGDHSSDAALVCGSDDSGARGWHTATSSLILVAVFLFLCLVCQ